MNDRRDGPADNPGEQAHVLQPLLTVKEVADYLRVTPSALYVQRYRGEEPGALGIRVGKRILYRPADLDRFLNERQTGIRHRPRR
ncbi:MAG TPA: helix-turn-helix domain-containing protein [Acidimicrobiia bacterium]|jgi:hypothetical protein|nr:helix-turn-helix domain-containing protein [Acidimicrobiia bacterium]